MEILMYIFFLMLFQGVMNLFGFKKDKRFLYCGIFGFIGSKPGNLDKIKILGIYNTTRGTDSCGIVLDDVVYKGVKDLGNFTNFIESKEIVQIDDGGKTGNNIIIGHCRSASIKSTKDDIDCAHPFEIKTKKGSNILIGVHNGTISNESDIAKEYSVKEECVDSKTLLSILAKGKRDHKYYNVLKDYEGAAALIFYYPESPNELFIFKGAGPKWSGSSIIEEERPLFVYNVGDGCYYFSSIKESLYAIGGDSNSVSSIEKNCLIKIVPGEKFRLTPINRIKCSSNTYQDGYYMGGNVKPITNVIKPYEKPLSKNLINAAKMREAFKEYPFKKNPNQQPLLTNCNSIMLDNEPFTHNFAECGSKIYFFKGRYWRNGHLVGGIKRNEAVKLTLDIEGYEKGYKKCSIVEDDIDDYYFFQGLLLKDAKSAEAINELGKTDDLWDVKKNDLKIGNIFSHVNGFTANLNDDTSGMAKMSGSSGFAEGYFIPMFDFNRKYLYKNGLFKGAIFLDADVTVKNNLVNGEKIIEKALEELSNPVIALDKETDSAKKALEEELQEKDDEVMNQIWDAVSSVKATKVKLEDVKDSKKFNEIFKTFNAVFNMLESQVKRLTKKDVKKEAIVIDEGGTKRGPLYT